MTGALVVALTLTLWSCAPGYGGKYPLVEKYNWEGKYPLVEKYNWEGKIDGQGENNPPLQDSTEPLISSRSGGKIMR